MQGDVFDGVSIPGLDDDPGLAMIITHACSMRRGPHLRERLLMGRVMRRHEPIPLPWIGHFSALPLPALLADEPDGSWLLSFEALGIVRTTSLASDRRAACLDDFGIALLNQRHAHYFTRYVVESVVLHEQSANVLTEAELLEQWLAAAIDDEAPDWDEIASQQTAEFDAFLGAHRDGLKEPARRAAIRRLVLEEIERRYG